eukprot:TRINITY_DN1565_c2_g1_i1.p1 TRINITY_DN1565_c2_g1~~TRINITY_DN1565_c2_g1_i1.p1  ORF type:complete len:147 (-),score=5.73 TRINITY_DN1565_c2_g1_i1:108-548(-)
MNSSTRSYYSSHNGKEVINSQWNPIFQEKKSLRVSWSDCQGYPLTEITEIDKHIDRTPLIPFAHYGQQGKENRKGNRKLRFYMVLFNMFLYLSLLTTLLFFVSIITSSRDNHLRDNESCKYSSCKNAFFSFQNFKNIFVKILTVLL